MKSLIRLVILQNKQAMRSKVYSLACILSLILLTPLSTQGVESSDSKMIEGKLSASCGIMPFGGKGVGSFEMQIGEKGSTKWLEHLKVWMNEPSSRGEYVLGFMGVGGRPSKLTEALIKIDAYGADGKIMTVSNKQMSFFNDVLFVAERDPEDPTLQWSSIFIVGSAHLLPPIESFPEPNKLVHNKATIIHTLDLPKNEYSIGARIEIKPSVVNTGSGNLTILHRNPLFYINAYTVDGKPVWLHTTAEDIGVEADLMPGVPYSWRKEPLENMYDIRFCTPGEYVIVSYADFSLVGLPVDDYEEGQSISRNVRIYAKPIMINVNAQQLQNQENLNELKVVNNTLLISFNEEIELCCVSLVISPDGTKIAYSLKGAEHAKIFFYNFQNKTSEEVFYSNAGMIDDLSFSTDGKKVLFKSDSCDSTGSARNLYIFSAANGMSFECTEITNVTSADWMPDGSLVVARNVGNETVGNLHYISIYRKDGTEKLLYSESYSDALMPTIRSSPDGKKIAFQLDKVIVGSEIYVLDLENGHVRKIVENGAEPRWSLDSNFLIYNELPRRLPPHEYLEFVKNNPLGIIKIVDLNTNETATIIRPAERIGFSDLAVTPDGTRLIYALYENTYDQETVTTIPIGIYSAELSQTIPEFPINLMLITTIGLTGILVTLRIRFRGN